MYGGRIRSGGRLKILQLYPDLPVAVVDHLLMTTVSLQRRLQREQMLVPVVAHQRFCDHGLAGFDALAARLRQFQGISLPCENGINNGQSSLSHDIANHMVQLHIHLVERFVHVVDVSYRHLDQAFRVPQ